MGLFFKTLRSFSRMEQLVITVFIVIFIASAWQIFLKNEEGAERTNVKAYSEAIVGEIRHLNPVFVDFSEADRDISSLIFSGLMRYNSSTGEFSEDIATHTLSEDRLTYTFTLKNEVLWHDGTEMTAEDIYFTYAEVIQSENFNNPILKSNFDGVQIDLIDTRTITFTLNSPNSFFFTGLNVGILPKHILGEVEVGELDIHEFNREPIGSGPYEVVGPYSIGSDSSMSVTLNQFEEYYGEKSNIETLVFTTYPSVTELLDKRSTWNGAARIKQSLLDELDLKDLQIFRYELPQYTALFFNTDAPIVKRNKVRLGISKAIDKEAILKATDYKARIDTPLLELDQSQWLFQPDNDEAQGALFDEGWALQEGDEFRSNEDGETLSITLLRRDFSLDNVIQEETTKIVVELVQSQLAKVGVELIIESYPIQELQEKIQNREYDILFYGQSLGYNLDTFSYWHSSQVREEGLNLSNYQNPKADFLIEAIRESFDDEDRQSSLESLAEIMAQDIPAVFLYTPSYYYVQDPSVTGLQFKEIRIPVDRFSNIDEWTFN